MGYGAANSTEVISYPDTISGTALTASLTLDPEGEVISTTNALGDVATSAYADEYADSILPELLWSYPGSSTNGPTSPPAGSSVYTYNKYGQVLSAQDPNGKVTHYGYYSSGSQLCYVAQPTVSVSGTYCTEYGTQGPSGPAGSTVYVYDTYDDVIGTYVDYNDFSSTAAPQTTTASYNVMGDQLWSIPPAGQSGSQSSANPYATVTTYSPANLPLTVTTPGQGAITNTYDAALNLVSSVSPAATTTNAYDADNRQCYQVVGGSEPGLTCPTISLSGTSSVLAGSTATTYVPGSTTAFTSTDGNGNTAVNYFADLAYPSSPTEVVDPAGSEKQYTTYNDFGNVCVSGDVSLASQQGTTTQCSAVAGDTTTAYNALGNETSITDPSGNTTTNAYTDTAYPALETSSTNALSKTTSYAYDADGQEITTTNPDSTSVATSYDADGRVCTVSDTGTSYSCGTEVSGVTDYVYNGASERTSMTAPPITSSQISAGDEGGCSLSATGGKVSCWGDQYIGNGVNSSSPMPLPVSGLSGVTQVSDGSEFACALLSTGHVDCWGYNNDGQLGNGTTTNSMSPVAVAGLSGVTQVSAGAGYACALLSSHAIDCWGDNNYGQLGNGTTTNSSTPVAVSGISNGAQISANLDHSCALLTTGAAKCWGYDYYAEDGDQTYMGDDTTPVTVIGLTGITQIAVGSEITCALIAGGTVDCWGYGGSDGLGNGNNSGDNEIVPTEISGLSGVSQIVMGAGGGCALLIGGTVDCSEGANTMCGLLSGGTAICLGDNSQEELGNPTVATYTLYSPVPVVTETSYAYSNGQLVSTTDPNNQTTSYVYNYDGQVACTAYPVVSTSSCGTFATLAIASPTNTIEKRTYDTAGRLSTISDWMTTNNTVGYTYGNTNFPGSPTVLTYPSSLVATYGYDSDGNPTSLEVGSGSAINDTWTYNADDQVATTKINGSTSATVGYNANSQITAAANLATSTSNDAYTVAANGEITKDAPPSGTTYSYGYNAGDELCTTTAGTTPTVCGTNPSTGTSYTYTSNGQRSVATPYTGGTAGSATYDAWNPLGELCNVASATTACGTQPSSGTSYQYNGDGLRLSATTSTTATDSAWDVVSGGSIPLNINDAATTSGTTTNTSYLYGNLLFGGTAPVEQISGSTPTFLVANPTGVQGVYSSSGSVDEIAIYSVYGKQTISSGSKVTPFGFQGSYSDSTGLNYLVNRYYDPTTAQFLSIDPDVAMTIQPYVFTNDDPLNEADPLGAAAAALMDGGPEALQQDAATINLVLESQMTNVGGPAGSSPFVSVAQLNNKEVLALILTPNDPMDGKIKLDIISPNRKSWDPKGSNLDRDVLVASVIYGVAGLGESAKLIFMRPPELAPSEDGLSPGAEWLSALLFW
jgi:RHS repeat-associated protein